MNSYEIVCDGDILVSAKLKKGFQERPLWKKMENLSPQEMLIWVSRFDSLCPLASEWSLAQALEKSAGLNMNRRSEFVRTMLCELNRLVWLTSYLGRVTRTLGQKMLTQQIYVLREQVFVMQEELTGGRILTQALRLGGCRRDFAMGDVQKLHRFLEDWTISWKGWLQLVVGDPLLEARLTKLLPISSELIEKWAWWGVVGKSTGVSYDSRKHRPHGAYPWLEFKVPSRISGDAKARFDVVIEEIETTLSLLIQILKEIPDSAQAEGGLGHPVELNSGFFFGCAESAKGPVISAVEVADGGRVQSVRLFSSGQRVWPVVDSIIHSIRAEDFQLALASLGVDSEESEI